MPAQFSHHRRRARSSSAVPAAAAAAAVAVALFPATFAFGVDGTWKLNNHGNWNVAANWTSDPAVPNGVGDTARFLSVISGNRTISQDVVGLTLGAIEFDDDNGYTISGPNAITLDAVGTGNATVTVGTANGLASHHISTPLSLLDTVNVTVNTSVVLPLTFSGVISGGGGLLKNGVGTLVLGGPTANNFVGDVTVNQGTLDLFKTAPNTIAVAGHLFIGDDFGGANADVAIIRNGAMSNASNVTVNSSGQFQVAGGDAINNLTLKGGNVAISAGGASLGVLGQLHTVADANPATVGGAGPISVQGAVMNVADGAAANDLVISVPVSGGHLTKQGAGKLVFAGANTYGGFTTISAGTLQVGDGGTTGGLGALGVTNNGTLVFNRSNTLSVPNAISGSGAVVQLLGLTQLSGANSYAGTTTITGGILQVGAGGATGTLGSGAVVNNSSLSFNRNNALAVPNDISGSGVVLHDGPGTTTLSGALTYSGGTSVRAGRLVFNTNVAAQNVIQVVNTATLELASNGTKRRFIRTPELGIAPGARLDLKDNKLFTTMPIGSFAGGAYTGIQGLVADAYNFGAWDQPGLTTSDPLAGQNAGALSNTATIGVATGEQILFIEPTQTGVFMGQTITGATTIAMYTYAGDLNFDGLVDGADYGTIDNSVQFPGTNGYANGDFNYDGVIDGADYGIIDNTIQLQGAPIPGWNSTASIASPSLAGGVSAVPEPASCGFAAAVAVGGLLTRRRRWR